VQNRAGRAFTSRARVWVGRQDVDCCRTTGDILGEHEERMGLGRTEIQRKKEV
jgi:hypothetical protein